MSRKFIGIAFFFILIFFNNFSNTKAVNGCGATEWCPSTKVFNEYSCSPNGAGQCVRSFSGSITRNCQATIDSCTVSAPSYSCGGASQNSCFTVTTIRQESCCTNGGGGGVPGRCIGIGGNKYIAPGNQSVAPAISQTIHLQNGWYDSLNPYTFLNNNTCGSSCAPNEGKLYVGSYNVSTTVPAGYSASYTSTTYIDGNWVPTDSGSGSTTVGLQCNAGEGIRVNWYYTQTPSGCTVTPPTAPWTQLTPTTATLHWNHGSDETLQLIRLDAVDSKVLTGDPSSKVYASIGLNDNSYFVSGLLPSTTYYWRIVSYKSGTDWKDFGNVCASATSLSFQTPATPLPPTAWCTESPNPLPNGGNPSINLYSTNAVYCYVYNDGTLIYEGGLTSGPFPGGPQTIAGNHQGKVACNNSAGVSSGPNTCNYTVNPPPPAPTCTISLSPGTTNIILGGADKTVTATTNCGVAVVSQVTFAFTSIPPGVATVTSPGVLGLPNKYSTNVHGVITGAGQITATVYVGGTPIQTSLPVIVNVLSAASAWFQVKDADVYSGGDLTTNIVSPNVFGLPGNGTFPGVPTYITSTDLVPSSKVSTPQGWIAKNTSVNQKVYNYQSLVSQIPGDVIPTVLPATVTSANFNAATSYYGYTWYKYSGGGLPLTINGNVDFTNKKIILLVENANLQINGNINVTDGQGFFMVLVKGNITVSSGVGGAPPQANPNLEGIYEADGTFNDSVGATQLWVRGSVASYGGVTLARNLVAGNTSTPAELFEFAPDQLLLYPSKLGVRRLNWKEVAP